MKRKNKSTRRADAVQPLPLPADAGEIAFAHGVSRRVVVVDAAESPLFEQIIYIVRDDAASGGVTAADLVQQARDAVDAAQIQVVETVLAAGQSQDDGVGGSKLGEVGVVAALLAHAVAKILYRPADLAVLCRRCAGRRHRVLPVLRLVSGRISNDPEGCVSSGSFSAEKPVVNA